MIDWDRVRELEEEVGSEDFDDVIQLFLEEVEERIVELTSAAGTGEIDDLESTLHFLKGSALNLGFRQFSQLCQLGETAAAIGNGDTVDRHAIIASFHLSKQEFLTEIAARQAA